MTDHSTVTRTSGQAARGTFRGLVLVASVAVVTLLAFATAEAGQRIHFKNGHVLVVEDAREEGDTVFLRLIDGSEVGFPKSLIAEVEKGPGIRSPRKSASKNSRSFRGKDVRAGRLANQQLQENVRKFGSESPGTVRDEGRSGSETVGYSKFGASTRNRKAGIRGPNIRDVRKARRSGFNQGAGGQAKPGAPPTMGTSIFGPPRIADKETKEEKTRR
ncbi:MAG: hypothetical protein OEQ13_09495 [Acidobacteriota bacterium]|nr:hypothetical protein [Acidobacteriota bacterium]